MSINKGFSHVGLATHDMDATIEFYRDILGFKVERYDRAVVTEGGTIRHLFMDCGNGQLISFLGPEDVPGVPDFNAGINQGLGVPRGFYHFAFRADDEEDLAERQSDLVAKGIDVSPIVDHDWARSIYFIDKVNGLSLEFSATVREFTDDDRELSVRFEAPLAAFDYDNDALKLSEEDRFAILERRKSLSAV